ncbi:M20/M25/M40 family metallo-hydrolase [Methylocella sp. CPCC 101449]|uniref:M20/M25/M40 family metallo-hydrolase n=1 Tax=Methylocella sp. CPCC 101449 TaxID=2987531 RepID=UPI00288FA3E5|nr:M20/M25/M40 family metallo-hydrolase [Methylocella sp. CPCC 101449]MDT2019865.1 M20/M25/M40 family metallo-hydrolase [Methylocella sp. CPCC 101449]
MRLVFSGVARLVLATLLLCCAQQAPAQTLSPELQAFRDIYRELVEINTTESEGDTLRAAQAMAERLKAGGFPQDDIKIVSTAPRKGNLVARLRGTGARKPLLLMAHIDVVEAKRSDWAFDPFKLQEVDGFFRARGAADDKAMAAIFVANLIEYVKSGYKPERDIILALTTDEELSDSPHDGAKVLLNQHRDLVDAELAINEGGGGILRDGKPWRLTVQLAEKVYQTYRLEVKDRGGHSASGRRDSAIYRLADGLVRLARFDFPARLNPVTKAFLENALKDESFQNAEAIRALLAGNADASALAVLTGQPSYNAIIRTTCVATMLEAGHAENALPQTAAATVNCRVLPDADVADVQKTLVRVLDDPNISVTPVGTAVLSPPSPLSPEVMGAVERIAGNMWPGVPVIPTMSGGYTDSRWARGAGIAAYGVSGIFNDPATSGVHGLNEQVGVQALYDGKTFLDRLVRELAGPARPAGP